jgi:hypothetical protein
LGMKYVKTGAGLLEDASWETHFLTRKKALFPDLYRFLTRCQPDSYYADITMCVGEKLRDHVLGGTDL